MPSPAGGFTASVLVSNTSTIPGAFVVQLYVAPPRSKSDGTPRRRRPSKDLVAFEKVALGAGESRKVEVAVRVQELAAWEEKRRCWVVERGSYGVLVGASSADVRAQGEWVVEREVAWTGLGPAA